MSLERASPDVMASLMRRPDGGGPRLFDVLPLPAPSTSIFHSNLLVPCVLTAIAVCLLFYVNDRPELYFRVVSYYIVLVLISAFYLNSGVGRRWLSMVFAGLVVAGILWAQPVLSGFFYVFRELPGLEMPASNDFGDNFSYHFVAAGLMEEAIKAVPALIGLLIAVAGLAIAKGREPGWLVRQLGVVTPMQGVLMGIAAGGAFTLIETLELYVPQMQSVTEMQVAQSVLAGLESENQDPEVAAALSQVVTLAAQKSGLTSGFLLLMPRILGSLIGHMSYAGIFGYFIGLAGQHRGKWLVPLVLFGWVLSSAVHAAWNSGGGSPLLMILMGLMSFWLFFTYYLKAHPSPPPPRATI